MKKKARKAVSKSALKRYFAMLLTVVTFITAIPLSNLMIAKAVDEYNYSLTVTIDLDGGDSDGIRYMSNVDRDGCGYNEGQWVKKLGIGSTFLDREGAEHTVIGRGADTPCEGTFTVRADAVGITPYVVISTPTRDGYTFAGWDTNTDTKEYDGDTAFEVGAYAPDEVTITATWERNANSMTISWDSGVDYVSVDNYSSDYNYTTAGQSHDFSTGDTIITKAHLKSGYNMVGFQEGSKIWTDFSPKTKYQSEYSDSWTMDGNRSVKVITETTLSFEYDEGFENSAHTETIQTDTYYKDYPKLNKNYVIDYIEELGTDNKWYACDGRDSNGSYTNWSAYKPRKIKYHSKLSEDAKKELNLEQNDATTKGTERVTVYQGMKISDITIPKREYTATFFDGNTKVHSDIINKFKFLGYWNDTEGLIHTNTTSDFKNNYRPGDIGSTNTTIDGGATYDGTTTYPFYASDKKLTTTVYAGNSDYSSACFRLDCYGFEGYVMVSYRGGSDNGESWQIEAESEDDNTTVYSGYDKSAEGYNYIYIKDWIEIEACGDTSDWWTDISVVSIDTTTLKKGYWYDENGKGLINYPLGRNHTVHARWDSNDITLPEAPAKEGYTFVGWRTEDAKLQTANWSNDDEDYLDCKNNYGGDVAKWFKASREGKAQNDFATNYYLVPNSYYLNDEVIHFQYYYVDYAGDDVSLGKDTKFIACYEEILKVTLKTSSDKGISRVYIDGNVNTRSLKVYPNTNHTINAELNKGYKFAGWYNGNTLYSYSMSKQITMGDKDLLLVAKSNPINYKIAYNLDGGTYGKSHPTSADYDTMVTIDNPSKSGYIFAGWTITGYDSTTSGHNAATWSGEKGTSYKNLTATDGATVTFTATWEKEAPKTANLQTTGDVGIKTTSHPDKTIVNIASNVQVSAVLNTGYVFKGWYNGNVKVSDDLSFIYTMPNKDTVLTAKTEIKWYTMTFDPNGGILKNPGNNLYNAEWKNGNTVSVGWNISDFCYMNGDIPTRRGYRFTGWYLGSESVYNKYGIAIKNSSLYSYDTDYHWRYDGNVTVKAGWDAINYKISYKVVTGAGNIPSQTVHYGDSFTLADGNAFTYTGHTFSHWYVRRSSDKKVFCYDGNWHTTDGSDLYGSDVSNWYPYNNSGLTFEMNDSWIRSDTDADEEFVFWGFWTADEYNIIYNLDGGTLNGKTNPDTYNIETPTFTLNNPTKTGYIFAGWCESKDTSYVYNRNANEVIKKDESDSTSYFIPECYASLDYAPVFDPAYYLAKYPDLKSAYGNDANKALSHFVKYGMKEGRQGSAEFEVNAYKAKYKDLKDAFGDNLPKYYIHYILAGKSEGRTISQASISIYQGSIGNRTYTATWTPIEYSIVYTKGYTNNAKDDVIQSGIKYNKDVTLISNPFTGRSYTVKYSTPTTDRDWDKVAAPAGFNGTLEFAHWNILSKTYVAGTKLKNLTTKNGDKITATAQWKDKKFTLPVVSRPGYVFTGWYSMVDRKVYKANTEYTISQALTAYDNTFTAQWTAKTDTPYKVEHYKMNLDGTTYTLADTDNFKGTTDASVTPAIKTYEGFTSPSTQTVTIKGDGTTVVKYYYIRNKYTLDLNGFISSVSRPNLTEEVDGQIFIAGKATVTVNGKVLATNKTDFCQMVYYGSSYKITTVPEAGYSIVGNTTVEGTMPASDKTVTITINANKDTKYIVRHWKEKLYLDGTKTYADSSKHNTTNYFLADTDNLTGQTNRLVTPTVKTYEGFTSPSAITVRVKGDGSLIVDYYYTRNTYTLKTNDNDSNKDDQDNGIKSGNGIDSSKTNVISEGNNKKDNKKKFKYEEVVTVTTDTLSGYHWHINDDCETIKRNLYPTGWSDHEGYRVEKWYTENGKTYGYKDQTTKFYMPAHDVKLDVNATNNSYKIIFEKNKPMNVTNPYTGAVSSASNEITGTVADTFYIYNHANQKLPGNVYNLTGWTFKGWSLKKDYSNGYGFGWEYGTNSWSNDLSHLTTKNLDVIHMYAKWEANRYQITFNYEHNSSNPYGNLGYDKKAEAATKLTKNGADSKTATYDAKVGSLPNPTLTGATFVKWVDSKGNEYTEDTIYKITSPITLYAVWQQNTGTFAYIANGITYNNNGIGVYEATNSDGTNQFKAMTEDITLEENKFGTTMENTSYSNFTKKSKYGYVVINAGTSYAKETDTSGDSVYYSFQGWSANNYATVAGDKNAGLIHQIGYKDRLFNYAYETMANEMNTLETGYNSKDTSVADSIRAKANELYNTKELTQNNTYAIMYAVWDQFPVIKSDQVVLTINDFSAYVNENADGFEQHAYDVIKDRIINANIVKDREDGNIRDNIEIENLDEILNMMLTMYKTPGMTSSMITIRTHVSDSVGNTTYGYTTVALINNKAKQDDPIIPTVDEDGKEINTRILSAKVRSITREFYNTGYEGSSDYKFDYSAATYKNYGGLIPNSIWYKNEEYVKTINQCFDNFNNNTPEQTWYFTHDDVLSIQEYAKQHKDTPHGVEDGELTNFYNKYKSCIIQGTDAS